MVMTTSSLGDVALHHETHPQEVEGCYGCYLLSVSIAPSATGSAQAQEVNERESRWHKDMDAYRAIRKQGLQPKGIDGSAALENRAEDQFEIQTGHLFKTKEERKGVIASINKARDFGVDLVS
jgi:hypothetical protein